MGGEPEVRAGQGTTAALVGWVLGHRRQLLVVYLVVVHGLLYLSLQYRSTKCITEPSASGLSG